METADRLRLLGDAVAHRVMDDMLVGLGTGSTANAMIDALGARVANGLRFTGVATSRVTADRAGRLGIPLVDLAAVDRLDLCIDGADEIDPQLNVVKGRGGALLFEKLVARQAETYIIIAAAEKLVDRLGTHLPLPVEIVPLGWAATARLISETGLTPTLRMDGDAPFVTDGGHQIVDCAWPTDHQPDPRQLARDLKLTVGVVEHGLFIDMADLAMTVNEAGEITEHRA